MSGHETQGESLFSVVIQSKVTGAVLRIEYGPDTEEACKEWVSKQPEHPNHRLKYALAEVAS